MFGFFLNFIFHFGFIMKCKNAINGHAGVVNACFNVNWNEEPTEVCETLEA